MARIRTIKPEFWTDGNIIKLSAYARLLFIGSWNFALCDRGHLPDDPLSLKLKVLPADGVDADALLEEVIEAGRIVRWRTSDGRTFLHIARFQDHQKVETRWSPRCPWCKAEQAGECEPHPSTPNLAETRASLPELPEPLPTTQKERKGKEGKGGERKNISPEIADGDPGDDDPKSNPRADVEKICAHLADKIESNGSLRPKITDKWRTEARLMIDKDGRDVPSIIEVIDWCQADKFWRPNIMSMPTLREKFDQLRLAAQRTPGQARASPNGRHTPFKNPTDPSAYTGNL